MARLTITFDLEDHRPSPDLPLRYPQITERVLAFLDERSIRASVFVVGELAQAAPDLVRRIARAGHEIGLHSLDHRPLPELGPERFRDDTGRAKAALEEIVGGAVVGYRAPSFSLTRDSLWAVDILGELGFRYSSSVLPTPSPLFGLPGAPRQPFRWPGGLLELPAPVVGLGPAALPYLGGIYFRYLPLGLIRQRLGRSAGDAAPWFYCHPYDFDPDEPFCRPHGAALWASLLLWANRRRTFAKLDRLLRTPGLRVAPPFAEDLAAGRFDDVSLSFRPS